jgi:glycine/D-amino acid oxidase-like deaminating enzyme
MSEKSEAIVIGGGINGTSIAFQLSKQGIPTTLLEKSLIAGGPTGVSSAICRQHYSNVVTARMALESLEIWQNFPDAVGGPEIFTRTGFMVGVRPGDMEGLKANIELQQSVGIDTRLITPEEIKEFEPEIVLDGIGGAAYEPESGYCDPSAACLGYAEAARSFGTTIVTDIQALKLVVESGRFTAVITDQGEFNADALIVAAGPWSNTLLEPINCQIPMFNARVKTVIYQPPPGFRYRTIWGDFVEQIYMRPESGGTVLVGSISPEEETIDRVSDPDHFNTNVEMDVISSYAERVANRFPAMVNGRLSSSFASLYDITPDWHPVIDRHPDVKGLFICAGTSGHGFKLAPSVGRMVAELVLHDQLEEQERCLFSLERFKSEKLVEGGYEYSILG